MRVPIDIDASLRLELEAAARKSGQSLADFVDALLKKGLEDLAAAAAPERPAFVVKARRLEARPGVDFSRTSRLLEFLGEERYPG